MVVPAHAPDRPGLAAERSCATTVPICSESAAPIVAGHALPVRFTQSIPSSFVKIGRLKPASFVARKFEQKRW